MSYPQAKPPLWTGNYNKSLSNRYQIVINHLPLSTLKTLDEGVYAGAYKSGQDLMSSQQSDYLYSLNGLNKKKIKKKKSMACTAVALIAAVLGPSTAHAADPSIEAYKLYAHMKLLDDKQYRCLVTLWRLESNWNYKAKNKTSSAYGIPQLLNMKEVNPYKQIDLGLKYINHHRLYKGDVCKALDHHKKVGHY